MAEYGERALRFAYLSLADHAEAEDVAQEAFVRLWQHAARRGMATLSPALLFHTVTNLCRDRYRYRRRHPQAPLEEARAQAGAGEHALPDQAVLDAVMRLNVGERQCILLFYFMDRSLKDIASVLGVSEQVVKTRLHRARQHLRPWLEPIWKEGQA